ncbi:tol-pal system YbgF family protein [Haloferula sp. A504]|uniref:tol-pal system YbgF family protein n=1 Tax=Haloferula sp. A504 TaxID=3373601 RepID=UPI0031C00B07|nr:tetratricopeptide repeat protein [Verrucomicrobiaceae bacterium E54]
MSLSRFVPLRAGWLLALALLVLPPGFAQERGSVVEDRAARKLLQAGDVRMELGETKKAVEVWESVIDRYPRSPIRFQAHLRVADFLLEEERAHDRARQHYEAAAVEANGDEDLRVRALLMSGVCHFESAQYGHCFKVMRSLIQGFPGRTEVNDAHYYIGLSHFKQGHYGRAIEALDKVGTAVGADGPTVAKVEAGRRLHVRIDDQDLAILPRGEAVMVRCTSSSGDEESVACHPVGREVKVALGSLATALANPEKGNGILEVRGGDEVMVEYIDAHAAERAQDVPRRHQVTVVGTGRARITDGGYEQDLRAAVLGKAVHLEVTDADLDTGPGPQALEAKLEVWRKRTADEIDEELARRVAAGEAAEGPEGEDLRSKIDPGVAVRSEAVSLTESDEPGVFRASVAIGGDRGLEAEPGQWLRLVYQDEEHFGEGSLECRAEARVIEGNLGDMRVSRSDISDEDLRLKTQLRTAGALTRVGGQYDDFGLHEQAMAKYREALQVCEELLGDARKEGGKLLEETYVELWRIYFAMDELDLALSMSRLLQKEFPESTYVDEAMLQQAHVEREREDWNRAIQLYSGIVSMRESKFRGDAQFAIGECYEAMALKASGGRGDGYFEKAFVAYKKVYEEFPDSSKVGEAVSKMASFYYQKQDYERAVDVFENVLADYPDAAFLDVILFNHGRCLYKLGRKSEARGRFEQIIQDFPESDVAAESVKIVEALKKGGF